MPFSFDNASRRSPRVLAWSLAFITTACVASIGESPSERDGFEVPAPPFKPGAGGMRRMTATQYRNIIRDLVGEEVLVPSSLEPDAPIDGLIEVGASLGTISARGVEQYEAAAYSVASQAMADEGVRARLLPCEPAGTTDAECARAFIASFGRRAYRRALDDSELDALVAIANQAASTLGRFEAGIEYAMAAMLQAPSFLFRKETGSPDEAHEEWLALDDHELAGRLAFFFWNTAPDEELLDAAAAGALSSGEGMAEQVDRLVEDDRLRDGVRAFFSDMMHLSSLDQLTKDPEIFVHMSAELGPSAREETLLGLEHLVIEEDGDYRDILTTRTTFLNRRLAAIYEVPSPAREGFAKTDLPEGDLRIGLLGQVSVLAGNSHPTATSATLRGMFVREVLLCGSIPPPPAMANTGLPEPSPDAVTLRERAIEHMQNPTCRGCHQLMDPIGLALENFDGIGRFRTLDNGAPIDASGDLGGTPFADAKELAYLLHDNPDVPRCLVRTMYRYANGRVEASGETAALRELTERFRDGGYRVKSLMREVALHRSFRLTTAPAGTEAP